MARVGPQINYVMFEEESKREATQTKLLGPSLGGKTGGRDMNSLRTNLSSSYQSRDDTTRARIMTVGRPEN